MKVRRVCALVLAIVLCAVAALPVFAGGPDQPFTKWSDTKLDPEFPHTGGGVSYVRNGAFDAWTNGKPDNWSTVITQVQDGMHWAQIDWADAHSQGLGLHNYALGLFALCNTTKAPGYGIAYSPLNVPKTGDYWAVVHVTAWGESGGGYNSVAWYAIYNTKDPTKVPASAWRELYPDDRVCWNESGICNYLDRSETVHIEKGSYIFLKAEMKYAAYNAWTSWAWDDIAVWDMGKPDVGHKGFSDDGDVTWNRNAIR